MKLVSALLFMVLCNTQAAQQLGKNLNSHYQSLIGKKWGTYPHHPGIIWEYWRADPIWLLPNDLVQTTEFQQIQSYISYQAHILFYAFSISNYKDALITRDRVFNTLWFFLVRRSDIVEVLKRYKVLVISLKLGSLPLMIFNLPGLSDED